MAKPPNICFFNYFYYFITVLIFFQAQLKNARQVLPGGII